MAFQMLTIAYSFEIAYIGSKGHARILDSIDKFAKFQKFEREQGYVYKNVAGVCKYWPFERAFASAKLQREYVTTNSVPVDQRNTLLQAMGLQPIQFFNLHEALQYDMEQVEDLECTEFPITNLQPYEYIPILQAVRRNDDWDSFHNFK